MLRALIACLTLILTPIAASAQDNYWVQIAARPTLAEATAFARDASGRISGVHGFYLGNGFYAIAVGPFDRAQADAARLRLLSGSQIPRDSFVKSDSGFAQQFWPVGGGIGARIGTTTPVLPDTAASAPLVTEIPDETVREARNSEAALTRLEREELQKALHWAGFYNSAIDGAFGRGTRAAMEQWQIANAAEPTGVLTTRQRALLISDYNAVLEDLGMAITRSDEAGIEMLIPTALVSFREIQPPFVRFDEDSENDGVKVLLISQPGDDRQLRGLYEIMQSLDIVPTDGPRSITGAGFQIEGRDEQRHSFTQAALQDGQIKGFTLVWPAGDDARRTRVLDVMRSSFAPLQGFLDPNLVPASADQAIDMISGLAIRQPALSRSGFFVSARGDVVTTTEVIGGCTRLTIDGDTDMQVAAVDEAIGLAVISPVAASVSPRAVATFDEATPRLQSRVSVAGYPFDGALPAPTLTFGTIADLRSLSGDPIQKRLDLIAQDGDAGGAILNPAGQVTGMMLPRVRGSTQVLPEGVSFAVKATGITEFLQENGIDPIISDGAQDDLTAVALTRVASDLGVLVSCW